MSTSVRGFDIWIYPTGEKHRCDWNPTKLCRRFSISSPEQISSSVTLTHSWLSECDLQHGGSSHLPLSLRSISLPVCRRCPLLNLSECQTENSTLRPLMTSGGESWFIKKILERLRNEWMSEWSALCFSPSCRWNTKPSHCKTSFLHSVDESARETRVYWFVGFHLFHLPNDLPSSQWRW